MKLERPRRHRPMWMAAPIVVLLTVGLSVQPSVAAAAAPGWAPPALKDVTGVKVVDAAVAGTPRPFSAESRTVRGPKSVTWPSGSAIADLTTARTPSSVSARKTPPAESAPVRVRAGTLPIVVSGAGAAPGKVAVTAYDRATTDRVGVHGLLLSLGRADGVADAGQVAVQLDYSGFADAFGGDWGSRLRLVSHPACILTTPDLPQCRVTTPISTSNRTGEQTLTASVTASGSALTVLSAESGPTGDNGDFKATSLSPAGTWKVSTQTGDFSWSLPMRMPPALGGPAPSVSMAYSSGSIDGRTGTSNNQGSWIGDGWDSWPGYVERRYASCSDDNPGHKTGDQCWYAENATLSLNGHAGELIKSGNYWKLKNDDGTRIEKLTDANRANGDNDNEYWKVTTTDGTQYFFGYHRLPGWVSGNPVTDSTWTVPVYGNNSGEPCYNATFASAYCSQAWRWNLDYVVDPDGNTMGYFYGKETGAYGRDSTPSQRTTYVRGGYLDHIDYGMRQNAEYAQAAPLRVKFDTAERCLSGCWTGTAWTSDPTTSAWPDTPWDQYCKASPCDTQLSPTFWTARRLTKVTTQTRNGTSTYADVESWALRQEFINAGTGEGTPMWLRGVTRTGHVTTAGGVAVSDPEITFDPGAQPLPNRVDGLDDGRTALNRWRIKAVHTESGGDIVVSYSVPDCTRSAPPVPETNTKRCMPSFYSPGGTGDPTLDWFHKYVVTRIDLDDTVADNPTETTFYDYLDTPAWAYNTDELTKDKFRTWGGWRGYGRVQVRHGDPTGQQTAVEFRYLRGMDGDRLNAAGGAKDVWVTDLWGGTIEDHEALQGFELQQITLNGPGGAEIESTLNTPWKNGPTASYTRNGNTVNAWQLETGTVRTRTVLSPGVFRTKKSTTAFNADSQPITVDDFGDEIATGDETCTRTTYARNDSIWMIDRVAQTETLSGTCAAATTPAAPATVLSRSRTFFDTYVDDTSFGAAPTRGNEVRTEELEKFTGSTPVYTRTSTKVYDANGRVTSSTDPRGYATSTVTTTANGGLVTQVVVTNPLGHQSTTVKEPAWDQPVKVTDANGVVTEMTYNGLGRLTAVWLPGRAKATQTPSMRYTYLVRSTGGPSAVTTETLLPTGSAYKTSINLYDGWLRERQNQTQATGGGRTLKETLYNTVGQVSWTSEPYYDSTNAAPSTSLGVPQGQIPAVNQSTYDGAGRKTAIILLANGVEKWRTSTSHGGDRTTTTPPAGGVASTTITDIQGQSVKLRQYKSYADIGSTDPAKYTETRYTYTLDKKLASVVDQAGNTWTHEYDLRGREWRTIDPDRGTILTGFDAAGNVTSVTAPLGTSTATTVTVYDELGRKTAVRDDTVTGTLRSQWVYDTLPGGKGKLTSATRFVNGNAYVSRTDVLDAYGRPTTTSVELPSSESELCVAPTTTPCVYTSVTSYKANGEVYQVTMPAAADLASEKLTFGYTDVGQAGTLLSAAQIYVNTVGYDKLGQLTQRTLGAFGSRVVVSSAIDEPTRRVTGMNVVPELKPEAANYAYTYDAIGNVQQITEAPSGQTADIQCYATDYLRRMTDAWTLASGTCGGAPTAWSQVGGPAPYWQSWSYDSTGNRLTEIRHGSANTTYNYTYPAAGATRPHGVTNVAASGATSWSHNYAYDNAGNTTGRVTPSGTGQTLAFDREGHLASLVQGSSTTSFVYDVDGERLIRTDATGKTAYLPNGLEVRSEGTVKKATRYYSHDGESIAMRTGSGLSWILSDHHGTAELTIDAATLSVAKRRTLPFGDPRGTTSGTWAAGMDKGFVGGTVDPSGLTHLGAREYDGFLGRFISPDPIIDVNDPQTMEGYAYGNSSPPVNVDASGECFLVCDVIKAVTHPVATFNAAVDRVSSTVSSGLSAIGDGLSTVGSAVGDGLKAAGNWAWDHRGTLVTIAATAGCFVPAVGMAACAGMQALAYAVRTQQTIQEKGGWEKNKNGIILDGVLTAGTLGVGSAFRMAQFGKLGPIKGAPLIPLPRFISPATAARMAPFQTQAWNEMGWMGSAFQWIGWKGPILPISKCYLADTCSNVIHTAKRITSWLTTPRVTHMRHRFIDDF